VTESVAIDRRFRGPEGSANGGYAAGLLAALFDGPAEVTLRLPPPLDRPLAVEADGDRLLLLDGADLVAEAALANVELEPPAPVSWDEAVAASSRCVPRTLHES